jgi:hypothetical protein
MFDAWRDGHAPSSPEGRKTIDDLVVAVEEVRYQNDRLTLRLGEHHPGRNKY